MLVENTKTEIHKLKTTVFSKRYLSPSNLHLVYYDVSKPWFSLYFIYPMYILATYNV